MKKLLEVLGRFLLSPRRGPDVDRSGHRPAGPEAGRETGVGNLRSHPTGAFPVHIHWGRLVVEGHAATSLADAAGHLSLWADECVSRALVRWSSQSPVVDAGCREQEP